MNLNSNYERKGIKQLILPILLTSKIIKQSNEIENEVNIEQQSFLNNKKMNNTEIKILVEME